MSSGQNFKLSLEENARKGKLILAQQPGVSFAKALAQVQPVKGEFENKAVVKEEQVHKLGIYAHSEGLWLDSLPAGSQYLTEGGESKVYLSQDGRSVIKTNDAGYYATWMEYFNSHALHNLLFPNTAYSLLGFTESEGKLYAVIQQPFVEGDQASLDDIEIFLNYNGFRKSRRQDYYHKELGVVLEEMHDENVLATDGVFVFYRYSFLYNAIRALFVNFTMEALLDSRSWEGRPIQSGSARTTTNRFLARLMRGVSNVCIDTDGFLR